MSQSLGLTVLTLAVIITYVSACTCPFWTKDLQFCNADFAMVVKVENNRTIEGRDRVFEVKILSLYRTVRSNTLTLDQVDAEKLYTPAGIGAACGVRMITDAYYIVSGFYEDKPDQQTKLRTNQCALQLYFANDPRPTYMPPDCNTAEPESKYADDEP